MANVRLQSIATLLVFTPPNPIIEPDQLQIHEISRKLVSKCHEILTKKDSIDLFFLINYE